MKSVVVIYRCLPVCLIFFIFSCKPFHPHNNYNYFSGSSFYNDTINISAEYFGDIKFNELKKRDKKKIKHRIKDIKDVSCKNLLVYATTNALPEYDVLLFHKTLKNQNRDTTETVQLVLKDTIKNRALYKKHKGNKIAYVFLEAINDNKNYKSIITDGLTIAESISFSIDFEEKLTFSKIFETYKNNTNYLLVREKLKNAPIPKSKKSVWMQFQYLATINSFISDNTEQDSLINKYQNSRKNYLSPILDTLLNNSKVLKSNSVINNIASLSKDTRVVMLNENHWYPRHRVFAIKLLKPLKDAGYTHLALETLYNNQDSILNNRKPYPKLSSGYYTREPFYAHLIRKAKALGFSIVGYENYNDTINRESGQAQNLKAVLTDNPDSKLFVYAGLAHINEKKNSKGKRMAAYLKELTNINPLTINQVDIISDIVQEPVLIGSGHFKDVKKVSTSVDYFLINNMIPNLDAIFDINELSDISISLKDNIFKGYINHDLLLSVYYQDEYEMYKSRSIPILNKIITIKENIINIRVPITNLVVKIIDKNNNIVLLEKIENK